MQAVGEVRHGSSIGSGTYLGDRLLLTVAHMFKGESAQAQTTVVFRNGERIDGQLLGMDQTFDIAAVRLSREPRGIRGVEWTSNNAQVGDAVFKVGMRTGVGHGRVAGLTGPVGARTRDWIRIGGGSKGGDSGGGIFTAKGKFVGPLWGSVEGETYGSNLGRCRVFCKRWRRRNLAKVPSPGPTGPQGETGPAGPPGEDATPPPDISAGLAALTAQLTAMQKQIAEIKTVPGPKGDTGAPGLRGLPGPAGKDADVDVEAIVTLIVARISSHTPTVPLSPRHAIVVVDRQASWWARFESEVTRAQEHYHRIEIVDRPEHDVGVIPQLVIYEDGKSIAVAKGMNEVSNQLSLVSRDEHPLLR